MCVCVFAMYHPHCVLTLVSEWLWLKRDIEKVGNLKMAAPEDTEDQNYAQQSTGINRKPSSPTGNSGGDGFPENHFNKKSPTKNYGKCIIH